MGALCHGYGQTNDNLKQYIDGFQYSSLNTVQNETLITNLKANIRDLPDKQFATLTNTKPKILDVMKSSFKQQLQKNSLKYPQIRGVSLPIFQIKDIDIWYEGQWKDRVPNGYGKIYYKDGCYYEGSVVDGQPSGIDGIFIYPNGSYKRGQFRDGSLTGKGKFFFKQRNFSYQGQWKQDQPHGQGIQKYADGSTYQGRFKNGIKQDTCGVYSWKNGKIYIGQFRQGYIDGKGKIYMKNGKGIYEGQFYQNMILGNNRIRTQYGSYQGSFQFGQIHGNGKFIWDDGKIYQGNFQQGQLHGHGIIKFPNGQIFKSEWDRGNNIKLQKVN